MRYGGLSQVELMALTAQLVAIDSTNPDLVPGGAFDMKASLAAIMLAGRAAAARDLRGELIVTAVADEEFASIGVQDIVRRMTADAAIVTEPTGPDFCVAHKGLAWLEVETFGVASHGSLLEEGVDSIVKMGSVLTGLNVLEHHLRSRPAHPLLGSGSVHASLIQCGHGLSTYPGRCLLSIERPTIPGETTAEVEAQIAAILEVTRASDPAFRADQRTLLVRNPFQVELDEPIVSLARRQLARVRGSEPAAADAGGWMNFALLAAAGIPTVVFGPDDNGLHADVEWVDLPSAVLTADALVGSISEFCA